jgi:glutathione peroxidase
MFDQLSLNALNGDVFPASALEGKTVLVVNVASRCGLTPQYTGLVALRAAYASRGVEVLGVPCNQFGKQEPGTPDEIQTFCATKYGVDFPLLEKQDVNGAGRSPLYQWLVGSEKGGGKDISWNFEKFVVAPDGRVVARFAPTVEPGAPEVLAALGVA